jgi:micrococcal nuclease
MPRGGPIVALLVTGLLLAGCTASPPKTPDAPSAAADAGISATVVSVHDGDTLYLDEGKSKDVKVRLIGIDAPEIGDKVECYGDQATTLLRQLLPKGTHVRAVADRDPVDKYGRALFYLFTDDGTLIKLTMVNQGAAVAVKIGNNDQYWVLLRTAEEDSRENGISLWGVC